MTKYIELEVPDDFAGVFKDLLYVQDGGAVPTPQRISRNQLRNALIEFVNDIQVAHGIERACEPLGDIDDESLDWPDLADTYRKARTLLTEPEDVDDTGLTAEQLENKYAPDGGELDDCHPVHTWLEWEMEVRHRGTLRGYWDWVVVQIEEADHD